MSESDDSETCVMFVYHMIHGEEWRTFDFAVLTDAVREELSTIEPSFDVVRRIESDSRSSPTNSSRSREAPSKKRRRLTFFSFFLDAFYLIVEVFEVVLENVRHWRDRRNVSRFCFADCGVVQLVYCTQRQFGVN